MIRATLGGAVGKGGRGVNKFALMVSAVCSASKKHRARARVRLTFQSQTTPKIQVRQRGAVRESIQSPCGSEQSKYRQRCQGVQVSDGLGGQGFKLMISRIYNWGCDANEDNRTNPYLPVISFGTPLISMTALKSRCLRRSHTSKFSDMATEKRQKNFPGESSGKQGPSSTPPPRHNKKSSRELSSI